jgi:hypothetical protein
MTIYRYGLRGHRLEVGKIPSDYIQGSEGPPVGNALGGTVDFPRSLTEAELSWCYLVPMV